MSYKFDLAMKMMSLFQKIGGMEKCQELADKIVETLLTDPLLKKKFVNADNHVIHYMIDGFVVSDRAY